MSRLVRTLVLTGLALLAPRRAPAQTPEDALAASGFKGGLIVHLGCGDGERTVALRRGGPGLVQGLDTSEAHVGAARARIAAAGLYGEVTARTCDGRRLPYADGTVNLLVVDEAFAVPRDEILRVLCPGGALGLKEGGRWKTETRPWPADLDEWTHYLHNPQGTMVSRDQAVGPPAAIRWMTDPKWLRNHDFMSSLNAMVSSGGRIFYIIDEGLRQHVFLPSRWVLIARDAFNGTLLWKRPLRDWHPANWPLKSGPGTLPRRLVAAGDRVFVTLGLAQPATALDAATGRTLRTYDGTRATEEILLADGVLYLVVDPNPRPVVYRAQGATYGEISRANTGWGWTTDRLPRTVLAVEAESGRTLWTHEAKVAPLTLTVGGGRVFFFDGEKMAALDRATGQPAWTSEGPARLVVRPATGAAPRVVYSDGVVLLCHATRTFGFSAEDGRLLWEGKTLPTGHYCPNDLFAIEGLVWSAHTGTAQRTGTHLTALDLRTGETRKDFVAENLPAFPMHPRCYPGRATGRYLLTPGIGTEFYRLGDTKVDIYNYIRGSCIYGVMPANGLLYKPPDSCACYYMSKLEYLCALAPAGPAATGPASGPASAAAPAAAEGEPLRKGPAYADAAPPAAGAAAGAEDWPMYRRDAARSGGSPSAVPADLARAWAAPVGGRLTPPVIAAGRVYVASVEAHALYALDAADGKVLWRYAAGGRIDSPPTVRRGLVLFGCADGWVYALRAADGAEAWRHRVAPADRQIVSCGQLESAWPVSGSVLVLGDTVYALAGRNLFFDGGLRLVRLDAATGRRISETVLDERDPDTGKNLQTLITGKSMPVANADLLSCDGKYIYMQAQKFDLEGKRVGVAPMPPKSAVLEGEAMHLFCPTGFLDDSWFHRTYWTYAENFPEGWAEYTRAQNQAPSGRIMVLDESRAYAFRADGLGNTLLPTPAYRLYAADRRPAAEAPAGAAGPAAGAGGPAAAKGKKGTAGATGAAKAEPGAAKAGPGAARPAAGRLAGAFAVRWQVPSPPLLVNAMALGGRRLFVAGPPDVADESQMLGFLPGADDDINRQLREQEEAWRGRRGAILWVVSADDGRQLAEYALPAIPVWDGMAVALQRLFMSLQNGTVECWAGK